MQSSQSNLKLSILLQLTLLVLNPLECYILIVIWYSLTYYIPTILNDIPVNLYLLEFQWKHNTSLIFTEALCQFANIKLIDVLLITSLKSNEFIR